MMKAAVFRNRELVGTLIEENHSSYIFRYDDRWFADAKKPAVSLTLPKTQQEDFVELAKRIGVQEKRIEKRLSLWLDAHFCMRPAGKPIWKTIVNAETIWCGRPCYSTKYKSRPARSTINVSGSPS
jgi:hypothetical protein